MHKVNLAETRPFAPRDNGVMAILARRSIQDLIDDLPVAPTLLQSLVARLNIPGKSSMESEWELLILSGLSRAGMVEYEPALGGQARIDARFTSSNGLRFSAEITAISDEEISRQNPVDDLVREINRRFEKRGIRGTITLRVGATHRGAAVSLLLPSPHEFARRIFNQAFNEFLGRIASAPENPHTLDVRDDVTDMVISYSSGPWRISVATTPFKQPRDVVKNAVYNRLKKKVDQIKRAGHGPADGLAGIILCDADCELLHAYQGVAISFDNIARHFLRKTEHLDFIAGVSVDFDYFSQEYFKPYAFQVRVIDRERDREDIVAEIIQEGLQRLPRPIRTPAVARQCLEAQRKAGFERLQYYDRAGSSMAHKQIRISTRATIEYITGIIDRPRFEILTDGWMLQILRQALDRGATVHSIRVEKKPERDDDVLEIQWREHDPASGSFTAERPRN